MNNPKNKLDDLCIQFFDDGEDEESREYVKQLEDAGYKVSYTPTSGASALMVKGYEVVGHTEINNLVEDLIAIKAILPFIEEIQQLPKEGKEAVIKNMKRYLSDEEYQRNIEQKITYIGGSSVIPKNVRDYFNKPEEERSADFVSKVAESAKELPEWKKQAGFHTFHKERQTKPKKK